MTPIGGKKDPQDQILESCLEEILGGQTPPDLKAEILEIHLINLAFFLGSTCRGNERIVSLQT